MAAPQTIKLLYTGFGAWPGCANNPAVPAGKRLDGLHLPTGHGGVTSIHYVDIPAEYRTIAKLVSDWHESGEWDAIVHVGHSPGSTGPSIEYHAQRINYSPSQTDMLGELAPRVSDGLGLEGYVPEWKTLVDTDKVLKAVQDAGFKHTYISDGPGDIMCSFNYASSLKCAEETAKKNNRKQIPVLFVHLPWAIGQGETPAPYTSEELSDCLRVVCQAVGEQAAKVKVAE